MQSTGWPPWLDTFGASRFLMIFGPEDETSDVHSCFVMFCEKFGSHQQAIFQVTGPFATLDYSSFSGKDLTNVQSIPRVPGCRYENRGCNLRQLLEFEKAGQKHLSLSLSLYIHMIAMYCVYIEYMHIMYTVYLI